MVDKTIWIKWFVLHLSKLRPRESPEILADLANEVFPRLGHLDPIDVAQREFDAPPPHRVGDTDWPRSRPISDATAAPARDGSLAYMPAAKVAPSAYEGHSGRPGR